MVMEKPKLKHESVHFVRVSDKFPWTSEIRYFLFNLSTRLVNLECNVDPSIYWLDDTCIIMNNEWWIITSTANAINHVLFQNTFTTSDIHCNAIFISNILSFSFHSIAQVKTLQFNQFSHTQHSTCNNAVMQ